MSCMVLIGGGVGCGKSTLIKFLIENKDEIFNVPTEDFNEDTPKILSLKHNSRHSSKNLNTILFDDLCSINEQAELMKTIHGWKNFRTDLLMASEHFINSYKNSESVMFGPLTQRSLTLFEKLKKQNSTDNPSKSDFYIFVEDNFYYRSMRYDWFQIAKRTNIGFCQIYLHCALNTAITRNALRGYQIPEEKIKKMFAFIEYPDSSKYKWEKYSLLFDSSSELMLQSMTPITDILFKASNDPAEIMITKDKVEAQNICSKNVFHQVDKIIRKSISKKIINFKSNSNNEDQLKFLISYTVDSRQNFLNDLKLGFISLPDDIVEKVKHVGIDCVHNEISVIVNEKFENFWQEKLDIFNT